MLQYITELDGRILLLIQEFLRSEWLDPIVVFITHLGDAGTVWIVLTALLLMQKRYQKAGISMAVALLLGFLVTNLLLKNWVMRPRPFQAIPELQALVSVGGWSFPSGHSTSSAAAACAMFHRVPRYMGIPAVILAVLICLSRMYVGVHYPTDVIGGVLVGVLAAMCALRITGRTYEKTEERETI